VRLSLCIAMVLLQAASIHQWWDYTSRETVPCTVMLLLQAASIYQWWDYTSHETVPCTVMLILQAASIHQWWDYTGRPDPGLDEVINSLKRLVTSGRRSMYIWSRHAHAPLFITKNEVVPRCFNKAARFPVFCAYLFIS